MRFLSPSSMQVRPRAAFACRMPYMSKDLPQDPLLQRPASQYEFSPEPESKLVTGGVPPGVLTGIQDLPLEPIPGPGEPLPDYWSRPGVYGIYRANGKLQYIAATRDVAAAIDLHREVIGDPARMCAVRMMTVEDVDESPLTKLAYNWTVGEATQGDGAPPGNTDEEPMWRVTESALHRGGDVYFKPGSRPADAEIEITRLLRAHKVLLFMKGTRDSPQCGFSERTVALLKKRVGEKGFECVDCLDELRNRGLRDGIKKYSQWPTIPQVYINGDFVGGSDIIMSMDESGELADELKKAGALVLPDASAAAPAH
jgi:Grx4 family monothiol glutaredoxin